LWGENYKKSVFIFGENHKTAIVKENHNVFLIAFASALVRAFLSRAFSNNIINFLFPPRKPKTRRVHDYVNEIDADKMLACVWRLQTAVAEKEKHATETLTHRKRDVKIKCQC
jgi:hypothetical protein